MHRSSVSGGGTACPQAGDESRQLVPAVLEYKVLRYVKGIAPVKMHTKDMRGTVTWRGASGQVAEERRRLNWESGGGRKAFSGPTEERGRCSGGEGSMCKGPEAERPWYRRETAYG